MPRATPAVVAFNGGELSPVMRGRVDLTRYASGCRSLLNMMVMAEGPATRRPGTRFVAETRGSATARLIPFEFNTTQAYVIEVTDGYFRFYREGGRIEDPPGTPVEVTHPYTAADLPLLRWVQSADVLYLAHPNHPPAKLTRSSHISWTYTAISFTATPASWTGTNYPGVVAFYEERLWWAGTPSAPQTLWASKTGDFENLTTGTAADDALTFTIQDGQVNTIRWLMPLRRLVAGTPAAEFVISASGDGPITPSDVEARRQSATGSAAVAPVQVGNFVLHVQRSGRTLWRIGYDFQADGYIGAELSVLARHMLREGVIEVSWHQEPWRCLWCVLGDGRLAALTYMPDQDVIAWSRHELGGTDAEALSVATIPAGAEHQTWFVVRRTVDGVSRVYVEYVTAEYWPASATDQDTGFFVDCGLTYDGVPAEQLTGFGHLDGETCQVAADGGQIADAEVLPGGIVQLADRYSVVHVGFPYHSEVEPMDVQAGAADGTALTRRKRVHNLTLLVHRTLGGFVGYRDFDGQDVQAAERIDYRVPADQMDLVPPLYSGGVKVDFPSRWEDDASIVVTQDAPLPLTLLGIVPRMTTND